MVETGVVVVVVLKVTLLVVLAATLPKSPPPPPAPSGEDLEETKRPPVAPFDEVFPKVWREK